MATNYIITGHTGEAHITSGDVRTLNAATLGAGSYVLPSNDEFEATIIDNHTVNLASGDLLMQGTHARIPYGSIETLYFEPNTAGYKRIDLIVARYENDGTKESVTFVILQGNATTGTPTAPTPTTGDILHGDDLNEMPLYKVSFDGIILESCTPMFSVFGGFAAKKTTVASTLTAANWSNKEYSFESLYPSDDYNIEIQRSSAMSTEEREAFAAADISAKADMTNVIVANGDVPSIDLHILMSLEVK